MQPGDLIKRLSFLMAGFTTHPGALNAVTTVIKMGGGVGNVSRIGQIPLLTQNRRSQYLKP